jgi:ATP-dependent DNA helicase RecG
MTEGLEQLQRWMADEEDEHLEFKEAKNRFDFEELVKYCCALANEGGGHVILGVTNQRPRRVVGSTAFENLQRTKLGLLERLHLRVDAWELGHPAGRVIVFDIPSRPVGLPIQHQGAYWMRGGESLVPMTPDQLRRIFAEAHPDHSAQVCPGATLADLDPGAIAEFRRRWATKSRREEITSCTDERVLRDAELLLENGITYAALVLVGSSRGVGRHLARAELVFEYRSDEASVPYQQRHEFRCGLFLFFDELWKLIDARNDLHSYRDGLFRYDLPAFNEEAVREAVLNAVSHRDYRLEGSIFVRQFQAKLQITSPGGFPPGITPENILDRQSPRNRRIAEALARCGLVERSGQGADRMFGTAIREGKLPPDFRGTDAYQVAITLHGKVQDDAFLVFLERLSQEQQVTLRIDDLLVLDRVHRQLTVPEHLSHRVAPLVELGAIERIGRGRGVRYLLPRRFYKVIGKKGSYTRQRGLDRNTNKALLYQHIEDCGSEGCPLGDLQLVLPDLSRGQVQTLLREMKRDGVVHTIGLTRAGRWFPGPGVSGEAS